MPLGLCRSRSLGVGSEGETYFWFYTRLLAARFAHDVNKPYHKILPLWTKLAQPPCPPSHHVHSATMPTQLPCPPNFHVYLAAISPQQ